MVFLEQIQSYTDCHMFDCCGLIFIVLTWIIHQPVVSVSWHEFVVIHPSGNGVFL